MRYQINSFEELDTQTLYEILSHRFEVFVLEQRCIYHDFDPFDKTALHMTAWDDAGNLVGYVRLLPAELHDGYEENSFGRLSVKASARHQGVGGELVRRACAWSPPWKPPRPKGSRHGLISEKFPLTRNFSTNGCI